MMSGENGATKAIALAAAASLAAVIGVATIQIQRNGADVRESKKERRADQIPTALLRVKAARNWRDVVRNDVFVDKAISLVCERLTIFVTGKNRHDVVKYVSELYNLTWDVACIKGKEDLDIRIIGGLSDKGVPTWADLVRLPELDAVFTDDDVAATTTTEEQLNTTHRDGLNPVVYYPLASHTTAYFRDDLHYFENEKTSLDGHDAVLLGGTFDHLHNGHKKLLSLAVSITKDLLIIGITSQEMLQKKKHANLIESLETRQKNVLAYVSFLKPSLQVQFAVLTEPYGPAIEVANADAALVVSTETVPAVASIQEIRKSRELPPLKIFLCRRTDGSTLSSSFIRDQLAARPSQ